MRSAEEWALDYCSTRPSANVWAWEINHFRDCKECQDRAACARAYARECLVEDRKNIASRFRMGVTLEAAFNVPIETP